MEINKKLRLKEELNKKYFLENPLDTIEYPHLDDTQLQKKISLKTIIMKLETNIQIQTLMR